MRLTTNAVGVWISVMLVGTAMTHIACRPSSGLPPGAPNGAPASAQDPPALPPSTPQLTGTSSVLVYINVVIDKKYGLLARLVGGMKDSTWERTTYDVDNAWWNNPLITYSDPLLLAPDLIARADAEAITDQGASKNVSVQVMMVPHADVAVKTIPKSDGIMGTITITISTVSEYYDGGWAQMVHVDDRKITFRIDTCDPTQSLEVIGHETRRIPSITLERYIRDEIRWEPKTNWPEQAKSGDWRVAIYGKDAILELTSYRYVQ